MTLLMKARATTGALGVMLGLAAGAFVAPAQAEDLTMGVLPSPNSLYTKMMEQVPERISRATGAVRQIRTRLRKGRVAAPYAVQRLRHSARARARFRLKFDLE